MGFLFAVLFLWLARPQVKSMLWSLVLVAPGVALRAYASGYVKKNSELTTTGPYGYTRNPLYLGSMLIAFGFAVAARSVWIALALAFLFTIIYAPVIRSEEEFLSRQFADFSEYKQRVPRLIPRLGIRLANGVPGRFSPALYRKHREHNALIGSLAIYAFLALRIYFRR